MKLSVQKFSSWCGPIAGVVFFTGFAIAGFFPPPSPSSNVEEITAHFSERQFSIMIGMMIWMMSGVFFSFFIGIIADQLRRIPGVPPSLIFTQLAAGALNIVFFVVPPTLLIVTAYRPDRDPDLTFLMNDFSWIMTVLPWPGATAQCLAIGLAILSDTGEKKIFKPWVGWYNIFCAVSYIVGTGLIFVKSGPFAWNSIFPFWYAGSLFVLWFFVMNTALLRSIKSDPNSHTSKF